MMTLGRRAAQIPFAKAAAGMFAAAAGTLVALAPHHVLTMATTAIGLPDFMLHRVALVPLAAMLIGGVSWLMLRPLEVKLGWARRQRDFDDRGYAPADDKSPLARRRPIFATDELGAPLMSNEALAATLDEVNDLPSRTPVANESNANDWDGAPNADTSQRAPDISKADLPLPEPLVDAADDILELNAASSIEPPRAMPPFPTANYEPSIADDAAHEAKAVGERPSSIAELIHRLEDGLARRAQNSEGPRPDPPSAAPLPTPNAWLASTEVTNGTSEATSMEKSIFPDEPAAGGTMQDRLGALRRKLGS